MWKPFLAAASLASLAAFKTVSSARALDKSPDSFNFPVIKAVAGANSPTGTKIKLNFCYIKRYPKANF